MIKLSRRGIFALVIVTLTLFAAVATRDKWFAFASYIGEVIVKNSAANPVNATLVKVSTIISQAATTKYIWFDKPIPSPAGKLVSAKQSFTGYGKIHVLIAINLTTTSAMITFKAYAYLYNPTKTKWYSVPLEPQLALSGSGIGSVEAKSADYFPPGPDLYFEISGTVGTKVSLMVYATVA